MFTGSFSRLGLLGRRAGEIGPLQLPVRCLRV